MTEEIVFQKAMANPCDPFLLKSGITSLSFVPYLELIVEGEPVKKTLGHNPNDQLIRYTMFKGNKIEPPH